MLNQNINYASSKSADERVRDTITQPKLTHLSVIRVYI